MKRLIDHHLLEWKVSEHRKPLILRGARQVGKTHAVRQLGTSFPEFVEINLEDVIDARSVFEKNFDPERMLVELASIAGKSINPGTTLLFIDEIQVVPRAITALRYFYEKMPQLHVIAAGSLLDFAIELVGIPVGRVASLYMYPVSFFEFLCACGHTLLARELLTNSLQNLQSEAVHKKLLNILGEYLAIGGMPEAVEWWQSKKNPLAVFEIHQALIDTYRQDFNKYAQKFQMKYLDVLFREIPLLLGTKFKYSAISGGYRKRELAPCLDLLITAGIVHSVMHSSGNGLPLGSGSDPEDFKTVFLDVALSQAILNLDLKAWFLNPQQEFVNKGTLVEAFVGQELLAYSYPSQQSRLFYWRRNAPGSEAEVDYLMQINDQIIPVEVKSGLGSTLKSMNMFLQSHPNSGYGIRFSAHNYSVHDKIHSYPLYAVVSVVLLHSSRDKKAYEALVV